MLETLQQARCAGVRDKRVLRALARLPQMPWVPAGRDPIWSIDQVGHLLSYLDVQRGQPWLYVGMAYGYIPALMASLGADVVCVHEDQATLVGALCAFEAHGLRVQCVQGPWAMGLSARPFYHGVVMLHEDAPKRLSQHVSDGVMVMCQGVYPVQNIVGRRDGIKQLLFQRLCPYHQRRHHDQGMSHCDEFWR